ncbi:MazG-like nucleotide pyrophosphohydrolase [Gordonia phage Benczkowski14]|uniref:MazG-like nucleotide pyrophosphohydrolase n=5 Tax=Demosthenesvirus katyusha TaxID=1982108 RepID=A0A345MCH7_9CAUD|nr:pyrophosphatase [Gordonia phage Kvothe]YP_009603319.1 pyrophosphatase [Gordonia phage Katyusha]AMS03755.1 MazG-like nucleotide pyrophosphohydrolase [Gordonia phage Benczkowski14]AXH68198.1 MazG-like nucleotide pyrophosphohydrolase [Gordonia phage Teatealatte]QBP29604.1 MazG-like nucleotide pyrophosphohydrolase [Gordonia phage Tredge]UJD20683.1 MazG-like pyrophosphohydrolase [Gordonia phage Niagara]AMS03438.1 MazG-like nucleotide pyrophosphohydrolase [Gordonia phage Katyusha]
MDPKYVPQPPTKAEMEAFVLEDGQLTDDGEQLIIDAIAVLEEACWRITESHGFHESERGFPEEIALIHSEVSEALEEDRAGRPALWYSDKNVEGIHRLPTSTHPDDDMHLVLRKPEGAATELADVFVRIADSSRARIKDRQLGQALIRKIRYNFTRPYKHGKKY